MPEKSSSLIDLSSTMFIKNASVLSLTLTTNILLLTSGCFNLAFTVGIFNSAPSTCSKARELASKPTKNSEPALSAVMPLPSFKGLLNSIPSTNPVTSSILNC